MEKAGKLRGQSVMKTITMYQPPNHQPKVFDRNITVMDGPRHARRPSSVSRKQGKKNMTQVQWADEYDQPDEGWSDEDLMPAESLKEDCYWAAGPIARALPPFLGPEPGPTDRSLNEKSSASEIMANLIPLEFKIRWCTYTKQHARAWREKRPDWRSDTVERSMMTLKKRFALRSNHFDLWLAARLRVARGRGLFIV
eukprot:scaffold167584_cov23-Tisochrysis_lutea.AAC.1